MENRADAADFLDGFVGHVHNSFHEGSLKLVGD
jgi:hypothetical protein